jgi:hypothetical protein
MIAAVQHGSLTIGRTRVSVFASFLSTTCIPTKIPQVHMGVVRRPLDLEKGHAKPHLYGFASVAELIASDEDKSGTIYRRFDKLSARNLLYLESKLAILESAQERFDEEDGTIFDLKSAATSWEEFEEQAKDCDRPELQKRMTLVKEIAATLKTYRKYLTFAVNLPRTLRHSSDEALYWNSQVLNLPLPENHTLNACRAMLQKDGIDTLQGVAKERLDDKNDLCSLVEAQPSDTVSKLLLNHFPLLFKV